MDACIPEFSKQNISIRESKDNKLVGEEFHFIDKNEEIHK